jgi:hypothetical protein
VTPRAVWSFWSAPFDAHYRTTWASPSDHLLAWVVSVQTASAHYPDTVLVTDTPGRRLLVEALGLRFGTVTTELDRLVADDPAFWTLGKLTAYHIQDRPFVHIDSDVFLWRRLPPALEQARVLTQNPEPRGNPFYDPAAVEFAFAATGTPLPVEWLWARGSWPRSRAENCGILGGTDIDFLRHYAATALSLARHPAPWRSLPDRIRHNVLIEQFLLSACIGYHTGNPDSPHRGVWARHLFPTWHDALDRSEAARAGFTHLIAGAKRSPEAIRRLSDRVRRDWPEYFRRCEGLDAAVSGDTKVRLRDR